MEVEGCEFLELKFDKFFWGYFEMRDLGGGVKSGSRGDLEGVRKKERKRDE